MVENRSEVAHIDPSAAGGALDGMLCFISRALVGYSSGVGRLVELQVSDEDLALRLALRSVDAGRGPGRG